jgi:deoxyribodipyrimidine photolyase/predicted NAD/FAD-dependent oxidoreductase
MPVRDMAWLEPALAERVRPLHRASPGPGPVVAWLRSTLRPQDNPVLAVASRLAARLERPLAVYVGVSRRSGYANDRLHRFLIEAALDLGQALAADGVAFGLHVERPDYAPRVLDVWGASAAAIVLDDLPLDPWRRWAAGLAGRAAVPVWAVDAACVVPMMWWGRPFDRAFAFREAHAPAARRRLQDVATRVPCPSGEIVWPFQPVPLDADAASVVRDARVDSTVSPVVDTPGGWRAAEARWSTFVQRDLDGYAARRNNPLDPNGSSRMSPYLHFGCISARRLAADATQRGGAGAEKFLDELLTWRELSWVWAFHHRNLGDRAALPPWARASFERCAGDVRTLKTWRALDRAETGDPLWDAAQQHLRSHGELHNHVRMTWGKAFPGWTEDVDASIRAALALNHRYALDGRDPASHGGILWCHGLFDRPFRPPGRVLGEVRARPTHEHAARLDVARYAAMTAAPSVRVQGQVVVVGAGAAGAMAARTLSDHGVRVVVVDKGRNVGGRLASRVGPGVVWRYGARVLQANQPQLAWHVEAWEREGWIAPRPEGGWEAVGDARTVPRALLEGLDVRLGVRVVAVGDEGVTLDDGTFLPAVAVLVTVPAPQAVSLLPATLASEAALAAYAPAWVARVSLSAPWPRPQPLAAVTLLSEDVGGRHWTMEVDELTSRAWLEWEPGQVAAALTAQLAAAGAPPVVSLDAHRWRYARCAPTPGPAFRVEGSVLAAGDWTCGGDLAGAYAAGAAAAGWWLGQQVDVCRRHGWRPEPATPARSTAQGTLFATG